MSTVIETLMDLMGRNPGRDLDRNTEIYPAMGNSRFSTIIVALNTLERLGCIDCVRSFLLPDKTEHRVYRTNADYEALFEEFMESKRKVPRNKEGPGELKARWVNYGDIQEWTRESMGLGIRKSISLDPLRSLWVGTNPTHQIRPSGSTWL